MIFQEPMTSLNPVFTVGDQIVETIRCTSGIGQQAAARPRARPAGRGRHPRARPAARRVPAPALGRHAPAGDDRDRAGLQPALLLADEPTTALDVTIQAQILELLRALQERVGMAVILITHDLGVVAESSTGCS